MIWLKNCWTILTSHSVFDVIINPCMNIWIALSTTPCWLYIHFIHAIIWHMQLSRIWRDLWIQYWETIHCRQQNIHSKKGLIYFQLPFIFIARAAKSISGKKKAFLKTIKLFVAIVIKCAAHKQIQQKSLYDFVDWTTNRFHIAKIYWKKPSTCFGFE